MVFEDLAQLHDRIPEGEGEDERRDASHCWYRPEKEERARHLGHLVDYPLGQNWSDEVRDRLEAVAKDPVASRVLRNDHRRIHQTSLWLWKEDEESLLVIENA